MGGGECHRADQRSGSETDRKSTRLNSSHLVISYAVFCLEKKKIIQSESRENGEKHGKAESPVRRHPEYHQQEGQGDGGFFFFYDVPAHLRPPLSPHAAFCV